MFSLTQEYALRAMAQLAREGSPATTSKIAATIHAPSAYLTKVMQHLTRAGLVKSRRGVNGGISLAKPANRITLLDVINAVDPWRNGHNGKSAVDRKLKAIVEAAKKSAAATTLAAVAK